jgi:hypothetical protein
MNKLLNLTAGVPYAAVTVAQHTRYVLEGTVNNLSAPTTMYLRHYKDKVATMDSTVLTDGHFRFEGDYEPDEKTYIGLSLSGKGWHTLRMNREIYLEPGRMEVNSTDSFSTFRYANSPINTAFQQVGDSALIQRIGTFIEGKSGRPLICQKDRRRGEGFGWEGIAQFYTTGHAGQACLPA